MPISNEIKLDRADWTRFSAKGGRCVVCGHVAAVTVSIVSKEITGKPGGGELARNQVPFCHEHGIARYADALNKLK